ncbi:zinc-alpha-2-glycoprotein-like [Vombatus ursinus]|uniref:zinc-alpha-2-glycoprotein-like n=1 Tax=Vombatus ursinus TaxID=29139 RepID=UPI000FFD6C90|nr:zinc-alpha-2-glycoprotein-like [Vombatus ursinus]
MGLVSYLGTASFNSCKDKEAIQKIERENKRRKRESFTYWLLMLGVFALSELQAEENKTSQAEDPSLVGEPHEEPKTLQENHTIQLFTNCEVDNDIQMDSHIGFAIDGEDFIKFDDQRDCWAVMKPGAKCFRTTAESSFGIKMREKSIKQYCVNMMRIILLYSSMQENVAPEVTVSRHDAPDGRVTLNCTATGFYPHSIQLHWDKGGQLGVWGQESSSGTLPNADSTFHLQITLELPPGDSETGCTCVVEHSKLQAPTVYPVPEKPTVRRPWVMALVLLTVIILVLSCAGAFITWKKKKTRKICHS